MVDSICVPLCCCCCFFFLSFCNRLLASCCFCRLLIVIWIAPLESFFLLSFSIVCQWMACTRCFTMKKIRVYTIFLRIVRDQNWLQWLHGGLLRLKHWANYISIGQLYWHSSAFSKGRSCEMMFTFFFVLYRFLSFSYACFVCALLNCTCCVTWVGTVQPKIHRPKNVSGFRKSYHGFIFEWEKKHREMCVCVYLNCGHWYFLSAVVTLHKRAVEFHRQKKWKENTAQPNEAIQWFAANSKEKERKKTYSCMNRSVVWIYWNVMRSNGQSVTLNSVTMKTTQIKHKASVCVLHCMRMWTLNYYLIFNFYNV